MKRNNASYIQEIEQMAAKKNLSVSRFIGLVQVDAGLWHKWKRGDVRPRLETIRKIRVRSRHIKRAN